MLKSAAGIVLVAAWCVSCSAPPNHGVEKVMDDKPFASGGSIEMQLDSGGYVITAGGEDRIRITFEGNTGDAGEELTTSGTQAKLTVKDTPHNNFRASIEVPKASNLVIRLKDGDLDLAAIAGNADIDSGAGDIKIAVGDPNDYSSVDASVKVGDLNVGPFGKADSGLAPHFTWTGHGKYTLRASLGAGDLLLKDK